MPNQLRPILAGVVALASVLLLPVQPAAAQKRGQVSQADAQKQKKLYCWEENGSRTCSDTLPSNAVDAARDEFSAQSGMLKAEVKRAMTPEERAAAEAAAAQRQVDAAAEQTRHRTEQAMLTTFQSEDELRRVFNERVSIIDNNIRTARYNVISLREGLVNMLRNAGDRELAGQKVPDKLANDIQARHRELLSQQRLQGTFEKQRVDLDAEIADTLQRFRQLKGSTAGNDSQG